MECSTELDSMWPSPVTVDGPQSSPLAAPLDPDDPASWPHVAQERDEHDQARSLEGDPQVGALITDVCALIRQCDGVRQRCWGA